MIQFSIFKTINNLLNVKQIKIKKGSKLVAENSYLINKWDHKEGKINRQKGVLKIYQKTIL